MMTHFGWSVQLYLGVNKVEPLDVHVAEDDLTAVAVYSARTELLAVGSDWVVVWRDERPFAVPGESIVGLVSEAEGDARDSLASLVGSAVSPQPTDHVLPSVRGIVRMGITPLKIQLSLRQSHPNPLAIDAVPRPLATFELVVYPDSLPPASDQGTVNSGGSTAANLPQGMPIPTSVYHTAPHQLHHEHLYPRSPSPRPRTNSNTNAADPGGSVSTSTSSSSSAMLQSLVRAHADKILELERALEAARAESTYFELTVQRLYSLLTPSQRLKYLSSRLEGEQRHLDDDGDDDDGGDGEGLGCKAEELAPEVRIAVAIAREQAREDIEREANEAEKDEFEKLIEAAAQSVENEMDEGV